MIVCVFVNSKELTPFNLFLFLKYEAMSNDFTINLGKGNHLAYQTNHTEQDFNVMLVDTGLKTMTGGRVNALNALKSEGLTPQTSNKRKYRRDDGKVD